MKEGKKRRTSIIPRESAVPRSSRGRSEQIQLPKILGGRQAVVFWPRRSVLGSIGDAQIDACARGRRRHVAKVNFMRRARIGDLITDACRHALSALATKVATDQMGGGELEGREGSSRNARSLNARKRQQHSQS